MIPLSVRNDRLKNFQDFGKMTDRCRGIYGVYLKLTMENRKITASNRLDLETLGFRPIMPRKSPQALVINYLARDNKFVSSHGKMDSYVWLWNLTLRYWLMSHESIQLSLPSDMYNLQISEARVIDLHYLLQRSCV